MNHALGAGNNSISAPSSTFLTNPSHIHGARVSHPRLSPLRISAFEKSCSSCMLIHPYTCAHSINHRPEGPAMCSDGSPILSSIAMNRSAQIVGGGGGSVCSVGYEASGDSEDKLYEVIDIHTDGDDDGKATEDGHDDAESCCGGGGSDWEADEGVMWFKRRATIGAGEAENHCRAIGEDAAAAAAEEGEKGGKDAAKIESENELEDNRRFWEACLANEYTQFVDCAHS